MVCSPLAVLKWRRKEAIAERQTSTPLFANSVRLLPAGHGSALVIARQTFAKIGQARADTAPSLGGTATTDAVAPAIRQLKWAGLPVGRRSARGKHCGRSKMSDAAERAAPPYTRQEPVRTVRDDGGLGRMIYCDRQYQYGPGVGSAEAVKPLGRFLPGMGGFGVGCSEEPTNPSTGLTCTPSRTRE